jgi:hypothetical protein
MVPSGLLGVPTGGPTATQGDLYNAIVGMGWAPQGYGPIPAPQAPQAAAAPTAYDKWGHVTTGSPQGQMPQAQAPSPVPSLNTGPGLAPAAAPGASGYDMWGRQAPPPPQAAAGTPQLPGLADIMKLIQDYQAQQALLNQNMPQGLLGAGEGGGVGAGGVGSGADPAGGGAAAEVGGMGGGNNEEESR